MDEQKWDLLKIIREKQPMDFKLKARLTAFVMILVRTHFINESYHRQLENTYPIHALIQDEITADEIMEKVYQGDEEKFYPFMETFFQQFEQSIYLPAIKRVIFDLLFNYVSVVQVNGIWHLDETEPMRKGNFNFKTSYVFIFYLNRVVVDLALKYFPDIKLSEKERKEVTVDLFPIILRKMITLLDRKEATETELLFVECFSAYN